MTREEAIEVLKLVDENVSCDDCLYYAQMEDCPTDEDCIIVQAVRMAKQALSQEPCVGSTHKHVGNALDVRCDDAVSRQAVIYYIKGHIHEIITESGTDKNAHTNSILRALINGVETMPSVTQKSGMWIKVKSGDKDFPESIVCSRCGNENSHLDFNENAEPIGKVFVTSKFCPNCGAKMERSDKE